MKSDNVFKLVVIGLLAIICWQFYRLNQQLKQAIAIPASSGQLALSPPPNVIVENETVAPTQGSVWAKISALATVLTILWKLVEVVLGN